MEIWAGLNSIHVGFQIARVTSILLNNLKQLLDFIALNVVVNASRERLLATPNISEQLTCRQGRGIYSTVRPRGLFRSYSKRSNKLAYDMKQVDKGQISVVKR